MNATNVLPFIVLLTIAVGITFIIAAIQESKHGQKTADIVRRVYLYLVSFVTLLGLTLGIAGLLNVGLRSWVFTKATYTNNQGYTPPVPYRMSKAPVAEPSQQPLLSCTNGCTLTQEQKDSIAQWERDYQVWRRSSDEGTQRASQLITSLSFLIIALVVFIPHWLLVSRDKRFGEGTTPLRVTHLWAVSFVMLLTSVIAAGFLLNTALKSAFLKNSADMQDRSVPLAIYNQQATDVDSIVSCGQACGVDATTVQHARQWRQEYDASLTITPEEQESRARHTMFAMTLAALLAALPLFFYHFRTVWRETATKKTG